MGWHNDGQPKERVRAEIKESLNNDLPDSYDREVFAAKSNNILEHIVDQAKMGYGRVA